MRSHHDGWPITAFASMDGKQIPHFIHGCLTANRLGGLQKPVSYIFVSVSPCQSDHFMISLNSLRWHYQTFRIDEPLQIYNLHGWHSSIDFDSLSALQDLHLGI